MPQIATNVLRILGAAVVEGSKVSLIDQLDRKLYVETDKVLQAAGGKWNRAAKAHVFEGDAAEALEPILLTGSIPARNRTSASSIRLNPLPAMWSTAPTSGPGCEFLNRVPGSGTSPWKRLPPAAMSTRSRSMPRDALAWRSGLPVSTACLPPRSAPGNRPTSSICSPKHPTIAS
nr:hypothetical protein [Shinella sumterensis]